MLTHIAQFFMALAILGLLIGLLTSSGIVPVFLFSVTPAGFLNLTKAISPLAISFLLLEFLTGKSRAHKRLRADLLKEGGEFILIRVAQFFMALAVLSLLTGLLTSSGTVPVFLFSVTPAGFLNLTKTMGVVAMSFLLLEFLTGESSVHKRHRANLSKEGEKSILIRVAQFFYGLGITRPCNRTFDFEWIPCGLPIFYYSGGIFELHKGYESRCNIFSSTGICFR